jgi:hypothetical protein
MSVKQQKSLLYLYLSKAAGMSARLSKAAGMSVKQQKSLLHSYLLLLYIFTAALSNNAPQ